ncbi:DUF4262 domain-containing protein [Gordonia soli]|uniref:DUF4262 domain-containing protein n=1 Tax=Gordonia soli NBRC 108243 TaxID=1223545 RepID=M0QCC4_9ACTN|nr:DUF4262 domain-containing protein [Gordonia soli]GAC66268.1 hypothetical protein GS4_01_00700 [Gordonia soli NBRC 108243]
MSDHAAAIRGLPRWHPNPHVRATIDTIRRSGWQVTAVSDLCACAGPDCTAPDCSFAYTSGLALHDIPELAVYGLDPFTSNRVLNELGHLLHRYDWRGIADAGVTVDLDALDVPVRLIEMIDKDDLLMANLLFPDAAAVQAVWPDDRGRWPWDPDYTLRPEHQYIRGIVVDGSSRLPDPRIIRRGRDAS